MANNLKENVEIYKDWDYNIKVVGIAYHQPELAQLYPKDWENIDIQLEPEPTNKFDPNAIKVMADGLQIGYIPALVAEVMVEQLEEYNFECKLIYITMGLAGKKRTAKIAINRR